MKRKNHILINYSNTYLKLQPSLTSFTPHALFIFLKPTYASPYMVISFHYFYYLFQFNNIFIVNYYFRFSAIV